MGESSVRSLVPRIGHQAFLACAILGLSALVWHAMRLQNDGFWCMAAGDWVLAHRRLPDRDPFSFASTSGPWALNMFAFQIGMALTARAFGLSAVILLNTAVYVGALLLLVLPYARSRLAHLTGFGLCLILILVEHDSLTVRAKNFGDLAFAALFLWLWRLRDGARFRWYIPVALGALWVNVHPSFPLVALLPMAFWALGLLDGPEDRVPLRPFLATALLALVGTVLNPNSIHAIPEALALFGARTSAHLDVHLPPNFAEPRWFGALALGVAAAVVRGFWGEARRRSSEVAMLVGFVVGLLFARRHVTFLFGVQAAILCTQIDRLDWGRSEGAKRWLGIAAPVAALALLLAGVRLAATGKNPLADAPVESTRSIVEHGLPDRIFNSYAFGGYLDWVFKGDRRTFWDGRNNLFENGAFFDGARIEGGYPGHEELLDMYEIETVIIHRDVGLARALLGNDQWQLRFTDPISLVFVRRTPRTRSG